MNRGAIVRTFAIGLGIIFVITEIVLIAVRLVALHGRPGKRTA
jgi:hypothetical protein